MGMIPKKTPYLLGIVQIEVGPPAQTDFSTFRKSCPHYHVEGDVWFFLGSLVGTKSAK